MNCPLFPEAGYPSAYPIMDLLNNWGTDDTDIPPMHYNSLCYFDYQNPTDYAKAMNYRNAELPFVVYNTPEANQVVQKWSNLDYLKSRLKGEKFKSETSPNNHFMYWNNKRGAKLIKDRYGAFWKVKSPKLLI